MPIYEYRCEACGHEHDELQKLADAPLTDCPKCAQPKLVKLVSAAGFQLKGTGWYQTDFRGKAEKSDDAPAAAPSDGAACTPTGASSTTTQAPGGTRSSSAAALAGTPNTEAAPEVKVVQPEVPVPQIHIPIRTRTQCVGCNYRGILNALKQTVRKHKGIVAGDIGCYSLGVLPPFNAMVASKSPLSQRAT